MGSGPTPATKKSTFYIGKKLFKSEETLFGNNKSMTINPITANGYDFFISFETQDIDVRRIVNKVLSSFEFNKP